MWGAGGERRTFSRAPVFSRQCRFLGSSIEVIGGSFLFCWHRAMPCHSLHSGFSSQIEMKAFTELISHKLPLQEDSPTAASHSSLTTPIHLLLLPLMM